MNLISKFKKNKILSISIVALLSFIALILCVTCLTAIKPNRAAAETIDELMAQVQKAEQLYDKALSEKISYEKKYDECIQTIEEANKKIPELQKQIGARIKEMYINRVNGSLFSLIISSDSLEDFFRNLDYVNRINQQDANLVIECKGYREAAEKAEDEIRPALDAAIQSEYEALAILASIQDAIAALEAQDIPVNPGGGDDPGGGGGDDPGGGGGGDLPIPYGDDIVSRALSCIGHPYGWGCAGSDSFDCSGLVSFAYTGLFEHTWSTYTIRTEGGEGINGWWRTDNPTNGTCCCSMGHCGIYYNGEMIHAPQPGECVKIGPIQGDMLFYNR